MAVVRRSASSALVRSTSPRGCRRTCVGYVEDEGGLDRETLLAVIEDMAPDDPRVRRLRA